MDRFKRKLKTLLGKDKVALSRDNSKLTKAEMADMKSALTEIELRDR